MGQKEKRGRVVAEYLAGGVTLRELEERHGVARSTIHKWVKGHAAAEAAAEKRSVGEGRWAIAERSGVPAEIKRLRAELEDERLRNELLNTMIDIAEEQLGIDIRKKRGARR
jgi:transposase-like protein